VATEPLEIIVRQRGARTVARDVRNIGLAASSVSGQLSTTTRLLRGLALASVARRISQFADGFTNLRNKVRIYSKSQEEANATTNELILIANRTRIGLDSVALTFQRLSIIQDQLGLTTARTTRLVELLSKAVILGGSSAQEAGGALRQFSQGLATNFRAAAQELNSVLEQTPGLAKALADGLGIATSEIKRLATEGKLTSDLVVRAIEAQAEVIDARFARVAPTIGQAFTVLNNSLTIFVGRVFEATGAGKAIVNTIISLSQGLLRLSVDTEKLNTALEILGTILGGFIIQAVVARFARLAAIFDTIIAKALPRVLNLIALGLKGMDVAVRGAARGFAFLATTALQSLASINVGAVTSKVAAGFDAVASVGQRAFRTLGNAVVGVGNALRNLPGVLSSVGQRFVSVGVSAKKAFGRGLGGAIDSVGAVLKRLGAVVIATGARFKAMGVAALASFRRITVASTISALKRMVVAIAAATASFLRMGAVALLSFRRPIGGIKNMIGLLRTGLIKALKATRVALLAIAFGNPFGLILAAAGAFLALLFGVRNETVEVGGEVVKIKDFFVAAFTLAREALFKLADKFLTFFGQNGDGVGVIRGFFNIFIGLFTATFKTAVLFGTRVGDVFKGIGAGIVAAIRAIPDALARIGKLDFSGAAGIVASAFGTAFEDASGGFGAAVAEIFKTELAKDQLQVITDLIAKTFPDLTAAAVKHRAAIILAEQETQKLAEATGRVAEGVEGLTGGLTKEAKALASILAKTSAAAAAALSFQKTLDKLNAAQIKGLITLKEVDEISNLLATRTFRELAAETDAVGKATIDNAKKLAELRAAATAAKISVDELASAEARLKREFMDTVLAIKRQNDTLSATDAAIQGAIDGFTRFEDSLGSTFSNVSDLISGTFEKGLDAINEFTRTGEFNFKSFATSIILEIQKITLKLLALQAIRAFQQRAEEGGGVGGFFKQFFGERLEKTLKPGEGKAQTGGFGAAAEAGGLSIQTGLLTGAREEVSRREQGKRAAALSDGTKANPFFVTLAPEDPGLGALFEKTGERELEMTSVMTDAAKDADLKQQGLFATLGEKFTAGFDRVKGFFTENFGPLGEKLKGGFEKVTGFLGLGNDGNTKNFLELIGTNVKGFGELIAKLAKEVAGGIAGLFGGGGGGGGGMGGGSDIVGLISSFAGIAGGFQSGGLIGPQQLGQTFTVGESGVELFTPRQTGEVISNAALAQGMTPQMPEINVNITNVDDAKSIPEAISTREGEQSIMNVIQRNKGRLKEILT